MTMRKWLFIASITGALAVLLAAFGEHALAGRLPFRSLTTFANGTRYQMYHALAIGLAALTAQGKARRLAEIAALLFFIGTLLFSGSLYGLALTGLKVLGFVTPVGGLALIAGWIVLALAAFKLEDK